MLEQFLMRTKPKARNQAIFEEPHPEMGDHRKARYDRVAQHGRRIAPRQRSRSHHCDDPGKCGRDAVGDGTLVADTPVDLQLTATDADLVVAADAQISLFLDEDGTATLPAGELVLEGRYVS